MLRRGRGCRPLLCRCGSAAAALPPQASDCDSESRSKSQPGHSGGSEVGQEQWVTVTIATGKLECPGQFHDSDHDAAAATA